MVRITTKAKRAVVSAAKRSANAMKSVAGDALGAAAKAAATVALESAVDALGAGRAKIQRATPAIRRRAGNLAKRTVGGAHRKQSSPKRRRKTNRRAPKRAHQMSRHGRH